MMNTDNKSYIKDAIGQVIHVGDGLPWVTWRASP